MDDARPLISTSFSVSGEDLEPDTCTAYFGLAPTRIGRRGVPLTTGMKLTPVLSYWEHTLGPVPSYSTDEELARLLDILWPLREKIASYALTAGFDCGFSSTIRIHHDRPLYHLEPVTIRRLVEFSVSYSLDIYDHSE